MTGLCTCLPDEHCPVHSLDIGLNVRRSTRSLEGGCNFCDRPHREVFIVSGHHSNRGGGVQVRFCPSCWTELR